VSTHPRMSRVVFLKRLKVRMHLGERLNLAGEGFLDFRCQPMRLGERFVGGKEQMHVDKMAIAAVPVTQFVEADAAPPGFLREDRLDFCRGFRIGFVEQPGNTLPEQPVPGPENRAADSRRGDRDPV
jgi:hypothetical protein